MMSDKKNGDITVLRRYDANGAWTHDEDIILGDYTPHETSMWKVHLQFNIYELFEENRTLYNELNEQNRIEHDLNNQYPPEYFTDVH